MYYAGENFSIQCHFQKLNTIKDTHFLAKIRKKKNVIIKVVEIRES